MAMIENRVAARRGTVGLANLNILTRLAVWRSRRDLARLDARALEDIGITADAADREARLSLWDVPHTWRNR
ncbi:MAG: DUF1127 domain-containing protein [Pseudomonadota bacterium]